MECFEILSKIFRNEVKIIGKGVSSYINEYMSLPINISYFIEENNLTNDKYKNIIIRSYKNLIEENPENTIIINFDSFSAGISQYDFKYDLSKIEYIYDKYYIVPIQILLHWQKIMPCIYRIKEDIKNKIVERNPKSENAIIVQGPVHNYWTQEILNYYAVNYPNDYIILSTWNNTPEEMLNEISPYVDYCVLSDIPSFSGARNRNFQYRSTLGGLLQAKELGIKKVIKTRTDMVVMARDIFNKCNLLNKRKCSYYDEKE